MSKVLATILCALEPRDRLLAYVHTQDTADNIGITIEVKSPVGSVVLSKTSAKELAATLQTFAESA